MLKIGDPAPDFSLPDQDGNIVSLADFAEKSLILYFYPKDNTPGCTAEACEFRDKLPTFQNNNVAIIGISKDSPKSHANFAAKFNLNFPILADTTTQTAQNYGVWKEKIMCGKKSIGIERTTFLIQNNKISKIWNKPKPNLHPTEIIQEMSLA